MKIFSLIKYSLLSFLILFFMLSCKDFINSKDYSNYKPTEGTISYVYNARMTSHGFKSASYRVRIHISGEENERTVDGTLTLKTYTVGDTLTVYFNPEQLDGEVVDKIK